MLKSVFSLNTFVEKPFDPIAMLKSFLPDSVSLSRFPSNLYSKIIYL